MDDDMAKPAQLFRSLEEIDSLGIGIVIVGAWVLIASSERLLPWLAEKVPSRMRLNILRAVPILRLLFLAVAFVKIASEVITPTPENLIATVGAAGLAIGFAFKDYVSSLIGGIVTIYERPYRPGDWLQVGDAYGEVKQIGLRTFKLVTPDDTAVTIPHSVVWTSSLFNANDGQRTQLCVADFYLHPEHDASLVRERLKRVALTSAFLDVLRPVTVVVAEKPWGTHYRVKGYPVDSRQQFQFTSDLTVRGKAALTDLGASPVIRPAVEVGQSFTSSQ